MASIESRHLDQPDESRTPDKTEVNVVKIGGNEVGRFTFEPGWRWSECVKPVAGTDSCQLEHIGYAVAKSIHVEHEDGTTVDIGPGEAYVIALATTHGSSATSSSSGSSSRAPPTTRRASDARSCQERTAVFGPGS